MDTDPARRRITFAHYVTRTSLLFVPASAALGIAFRSVVAGVLSYVFITGGLWLVVQAAVTDRMSSPSRIKVAVVLTCVAALAFTTFLALAFYDAG
jgi:hypothetical protein